MFFAQIKQTRLYEFSRNIFSLYNQRDKLIIHLIDNHIPIYGNLLLFKSTSLDQ